MNPLQSARRKSYEFMSREGEAPVERRIAAGVLIAGTLAAALAAAVFWKLTDRRASDAARVESIADGLAKTLTGGANPQPALAAVVDSGVVTGAVLYDANGTALARAGAPTTAASEVVCRSIPGGTLCVEPLPPAPPPIRALLIAGASGLALAILAAIVIPIAVRPHVRAIRLDVERAAAEEIRIRETELRRRSYDLELANKDLESFAHTVSHDLRGPLGSVLGFAEALRDGDGGELNEDGRESVHWILESSHTMRDLIDGLLQMSRLSREELDRSEVDLSSIAKGIAYSLQKAGPSREVEFRIADDVVANGDERLLRAVMENLLTNAWKFTSKREHARIEFGKLGDNSHTTFFVRDNGAGFDPAHAAKMFRPFQRLHSAKEFEGTGIGLATVQRILQKHGGKAWAEGDPDRGATVYFTTDSP